MEFGLSISDLGDVLQLALFSARSLKYTTSAWYFQRECFCPRFKLSDTLATIPAVCQPIVCLVGNYCKVVAIVKNDRYHLAQLFPANLAYEIQHRRRYHATGFQ